MTTFTNQTSYMVQNYDLDHALLALTKGGLILYPTDTIWSIGCDATNPGTIQKLFRLKQNPSYQNVEILVDSIKMLRNYVQHLHPRIETLLIYHLRPLTVLFERAINLPKSLMGPGRTIAIRLVQDQYCRSLIEAFGKPIVATSANVHKEPLPAYFGSVSSTIIQGVDYVVKHRQQEKSHGYPSVMVKLSDKDELIFLRE